MYQRHSPLVFTHGGPEGAGGGTMAAPAVLLASPGKTRWRFILDMPARYRFHSIQRSDRLNHDRRIRILGGTNPDGSRWKISEETAIAGIEDGRWSFFITQGAREIDVIVAVSRYGNKYLKTAEDEGANPDRLLTLPECR
jgi:hypothetical protein